MRYICFLTILFFFTVGCADRSEIDSTGKCDVISVDPTEKQTINRSELFSLESIIKLENSPDLGRIRWLSPHNDVMIISSENIRLYDYQGNFIRKIGKRGKGPGEYMSKFLYHEDEYLWVMDRNQQKLIQYRLEDGVSISEENFQFWGQAIMRWQGMTLIYTSNQPNKYDNKKLLVFDENNNFINSYFDIKEYETRYMHFFDNKNFYSYKDSLRFLYSFNDNIYNIEGKKGDISITKRYCVDFGEHAIPDDFFQRPFQNVAEFRDALDESNYAFSVQGPIEMDHTIIFIFWYGEKPHFAIYSKEEKETIITEKIHDDLLFKGLEMAPRDEYLPAYFFHKGSVYFVMNSFQLIDNVEKVKEEHPNVELDRRIMNLYKTIDDNDNPVIFKLNMKKY